jgi:excisionase family DNA binding protein
MTDAKEVSGWLTCETAARYAGVSTKTIRRAVEDGRLSGCRWGRKWLFRPEDIDELIEAGRVRLPQRKTA